MNKKTTMKTKVIRTLILVILTTVTVHAQNYQSFDIAPVKNIIIDGQADDWPTDAFNAQLLASPDGNFKSPDDFDMRFKLGWDKKGLLIFVFVRDNKIVEHSNVFKYWSYDSFNLIMAPGNNSNEIFQLNISPGVSDEFSELRYHVFDERSGLKKTKIKVEAARRKTPNGYHLEIRLPWENLSIAPKVGSTAALQIYGTDTDKKENGFHLPWYPEFGAQENPNLMYQVRLAKKASHYENISVSGEIVNMRHKQISVVTDNTFAGKNIRVFNSKGTIARQTLSLNKGRASAKITLPLPALGETDLPVKVEIAKEYIRSVDITDVNEMRANEFVKSELEFDNWIFNSTSFPKCDFKHPYYVRDLIGTYTIETKFFNQNFEEVTEATTAGRYGAVVKIIPQYGRTLRRFFNLYKYPKDFQWWKSQINSTDRMFTGLGIDSSLVAAQSKIITEFSNWRLMQDFCKKPMGSFLLSNLSNSLQCDKELNFRELSSVDKEWWFKFKRIFYNAEDQYPDSIVCPKEIPTLHSPVLHKGSAKEAGIKEGNTSKVDSICKIWAEDSDQAFAVLLARNGVIYFHSAYGQRGGKPMTVDTRSWMASITKLLSGSLMMMLVDQDYVDLDEPVEKFLPPFRNAQTRKKLTIRSLYNHTNGLEHSWGDNTNDLEEIVGSLYPHLQIGEEYSYNGCGFALGGKIIELISGETIPEFYKKHLLHPLNCNNTIVTGTAGDASSTPMDMAVISQMLLNKGAYGNKRFFNEETFHKMLPLNLSDQIGKNTTRCYGVGTKWFDKEGFGKGTFGHTAASKATLRIDPENNLIVIMTRDRGGSNFEKYHPQFIKAVVDGIE